METISTNGLRDSFETSKDLGGKAKGKKRLPRQLDADSFGAAGGNLETLPDGLSALSPNGESLKAAQQAVQGWIQSLIDTSGRNPLLFLKPNANLPLEGADPAALERLLRGEEVRLWQLFPETLDGYEARKEAIKKIASLHKRMVAYDEERGVNVGQLVSGLVQWNEVDEGKSREPNAPLLLRELFISQPRRGTKDFVLRADLDVEVNNVLMHLFSRDFGVECSEDEIWELEALAEESFSQPYEVIQRAKKLFADVDGLKIEPSLSVGAFLYQKMPMVKDLEENLEVFADSDLVAAVAGSTSAIDRIRTQVGEVHRNDPDKVLPSHEFLVLDADPSQNYAINAVAAGRNVIIQGPPGTGKSQTISNLIATSIADGKKVLFVAEKRAAIDAVTSRLSQVGLESLILDLHGGAKKKAHVTQSISDSIQLAGQIGYTDFREMEARLVKSRKSQISHVNLMHEKQEPWSESLFDLQGAALQASKDCKLDYLIPDEVIVNLYGETLSAVREQLQDAGSLGAFLPIKEQSPWATATEIRQSDATALMQLARSIDVEYIPAAQQAFANILEHSETSDPKTLTKWKERLALHQQVNKTLGDWDEEIFAEDLPRLLDLTATRSFRRANSIESSWSERRTARKLAQSKAKRRFSGSTLHKELLNVQEVMTAWTNIVKDDGGYCGPIFVDVEAALLAFDQLRSSIEQLGDALQRDDLYDLSLKKLKKLVASLVRDPSEITKRCQINEIMTQLQATGLTPFIEVLTKNAAKWSTVEAERKAPEAFAFVWAQSIVKKLTIDVPAYGRFDGAKQNQNARTFAESDRQHLRGTPQRILRRNAERLSATRSADSVADTKLSVELQRKRKVKPIRHLLPVAPNVISSAKPCWVMSPLVVSQVLPPDMKFDLVIFDEASQIPPADAIPSLGRARQAVICGDSKQMPPSSAFMESDGDLGEEDFAEDDEIMEALSADAESILDVFDSALGSTLASEYRLLWHYRSTDARLINFSNSWFYSGSLTAFPGISEAAPLRHHLVKHPLNQPQNISREVSDVVKVALEHAQTRSDQSLGIIAMSIQHARRIEEELDRQLAELDDPELDEFFSQDGSEPFFVKNLERVQGDERDSIIISIGYIKTPDGRMQYRFGPLNNAGGERRLNVAVTRAKHDLTLVSSFGAEDLDPERLNSEGGKALRAYLQYASSEGQDLGEVGTSDRPLNPFEMHILERLRKAQVPVIPQYGVAGYWIDFVASHPTQPGRLILAIEADGAQYHSSETARARDRLRQEHLERLGWHFHRIWSTDYFRDPDAVIAKVKVAYDEAVARADREHRDQQEPLDLPPHAEEYPSLPGAQQRGKRFPVATGRPINTYRHSQLVAVVEWVMSDGLLRTDEELLTEAIKDMGYSRRGHRIEEALSSAIRSYRSAKSR